MRKRTVTIKATEVNIGHRFVLGNSTYRVGATGLGHSEITGEFVLIVAQATTPDKTLVEIEMSSQATFDILKK